MSHKIEGLAVGMGIIIIFSSSSTSSTTTSIIHLIGLGRNDSFLLVVVVVVLQGSLGGNHNLLGRKITTQSLFDLQRNARWWLVAAVAINRSSGCIIILCIISNRSAGTSLFDFHGDS